MIGGRFDILASSKTDYHCKVKETLFIQELQPAMNANVRKAFTLLGKLFYWITLNGVFVWNVLNIYCRCFLSKFPGADLGEGRGGRRPNPHRRKKCRQGKQNKTAQDLDPTLVPDPSWYSISSISKDFNCCDVWKCMLTSIRNVKFIKCIFFKCLSSLFVLHF